MAPSLTPIPFWFLRHGQTDWNARDLAQGSIDVPLNVTGLEQARAAAALLPGRGITAIVASPVSRARITAEIAAEALQVPVAIDDDLREASYGDMEGQSMMLGTWFAEWVEGKATPRHAESFEAIKARAVAAINRATAGPGPVLIVAHGAVFRTVRAAMGLEPNVRTQNGVPFLCTPGDPWSLTPPG